MTALVLICSLFFLDFDANKPSTYVAPTAELVGVVDQAEENSHHEGEPCPSYSTYSLALAFHTPVLSALHSAIFVATTHPPYQPQAPPLS